MTRGDDAAGVLGDATAALVLAPSVRDTAASATAALLESGERTHDRVVAVTVGQSADSWLRAWDRHVDAATKVSCVDVAVGTRSAATTDGGARKIPFEQITEPADLESLGRTISDVLERTNDNGERVGLAVHSLTDLLGFVDEPTVFKFVYTLGEVVRRVDGAVYFHLDPAAHDEESVDTFAAACDAVVDVGDDVTVTPQADW